jgi:methionyl-tRNA synthetase
MKLAENLEISIEEKKVDDNFAKLIKGLEFGKALDYVWTIIREANQFIGETKPWELIKTDEKKFQEVMQRLLVDIDLVGRLIEPFLPETAEKIKKALATKELPMLFPRIK